MPHWLSGPSSITRRPDTFSTDYTISHSFGPYALGDNTKGMLNRVWRIRTDGMNLWLARSDDTFNNYDAEILLVTIPAGQPPIDELDIAFDQNARVTICTQRMTGPLTTPEIWLYWYDPVAGSYTFSAMAFGRNPRAILDEPVPQSQTSDVLIWYFSNTVQVLAYRRQRDRYSTEYYINTITSDNRFLEDAYRSIDNRVHVLWSDHFLAPGQYGLDHVESTLMPFWPPPDSLQASITLSPFTSLRAALIDNVPPPELFTAGLTFNVGMAGGASLVNALIDYLNAREEFKAALVLTGGALVIGLKSQDQFLGETDGLQAALTLPSMTLVVVLFDIIQPPDGMTAGVTLTGGTLGP